MKYKFYTCPFCSAKKFRHLLKINKVGLVCNNCKEFYPIYKGLPVLLTFQNDFYHLKKALTPAKYRVNKFEH
jgi:uncharacterized protein YbaR (Trm112 family)